MDDAADFRVAVDVDAGAADAAERPGQHSGSIFVEGYCEISIEMRHCTLLKARRHERFVGADGTTLAYDFSVEER